MNQLAVTNDVLATQEAIQEMAALLAAFPEPDKWSPEQKAQTVTFAALWETAQRVTAAKNIAAIDWESEKEKFLNSAGKTNSGHTRRAYARALARLEAWASAQETHPLELSPALADDWIGSLKAEGRATASVRLDVAAMSSFYTWLERRHPKSIRNPFRGTKARPARKPAKKIEVPSAEEVAIMLAELPPFEAAAAAVMALSGLRAGALPGLSIRANGRFDSRSKGHDVSGTLPPEAASMILAAELPCPPAGRAQRSPFAGIAANTLEKRFARGVSKLHKAGRVRAAYSAHDLRHHFAVTEYRKDKDIHRVSRLLGHSSIAVTETYLRSLGEADER